MFLLVMVFRTLVVVTATPFILLWPRSDKTLTYGQTVWLRYKRVFGFALA